MGLGVLPLILLLLLLGALLEVQAQRPLYLHPNLREAYGDQFAPEQPNPMVLIEQYRRAASFRIGYATPIGVCLTKDSCYS